MRQESAINCKSEEYRKNRNIDMEIKLHFTERRISKKKRMSGKNQKMILLKSQQK